MPTRQAVMLLFDSDFHQSPAAPGDRLHVPGPYARAAQVSPNLETFKEQINQISGLFRRRLPVGVGRGGRNEGEVKTTEREG